MSHHPTPSALCLGEEPVLLKLGETERLPGLLRRGEDGIVSSRRPWALTHLFPVHGLLSGTCYPRSVLLASGAGMADCMLVLGAQS